MYNVKTQVHFHLDKINFTMPGVYSKQSNLDRERLVNSWRRGEDYLDFAAQMQIEKSTARSIIKVYRTEGRIDSKPRGGRRHTKITDEMKNAILDYVSKQPDITLVEMNRRLLVDRPDDPQVTTQAINGFLDGQLITTKRLYVNPISWNTQENKEHRRDFMQWLLRDGVRTKLVYVDEFGSNIWTSRGIGRAPAGQRAVRVVPGQRGRNLTVCIAVSATDGLLHWKFVDGGMTKDLFQEFLSELSALHPDAMTVVLDNARCHINLPAMEENHELHHLSPYSPFLNMAEQAISVIKSSLKTRIGSPECMVEMQNAGAAVEAHVTLPEWRRQILRRELENCFPSVTTAKTHNMFMHTFTYAERVINLEDIWG